MSALPFPPNRLRAPLLGALIATLLATMCTEGVGQVPDSGRALPDIVVTATRTPVSLPSLAASVVVIDRSALELHQATTADQALRGVPGINIVGDGAFGQEVRVNLRGLNSGFSTQRTLILLDGRPLTDEYLGHTDLVQYPLDAIERIEVVRGGSSAAYGTSALGGVINLIPRRGGAVPSTTLSAMGGSHTTVEGSLTHGRRLGAVDLFISGGVSTTDGYRRNSAGNRVDWDGRHGEMNLGWTGPGVSLRSLTNVFHGDGTDDLFDRRMTRIGEDLGLKVATGEGSELSARVYLNHLGQTLAWFGAPEVEYHQTGIGSVISQTIPVGARHRLLAGLEARHNQARVTEFAGLVDRHETIGALFLQDEIDLNRVGLLLGLRGDRGGQGETSLSFRGGARVDVGPRTTLRLGVTRAFRAPTLSDRYLPATPFGPGVIFVGNPDLKPETAISGELGLTQRFSSSVTFELTGFAIRSKGFWDFIADTGTVFKAENITTVPIYGLETTLRATLMPSLTATLSYAFNDARYDRFVGNPQVEGNLVDDNVRHSGSAGLEWTSHRGHSIYGALQLVGTRYTDPENSADGTLDGYALLSAGAAIRLIAPLTLRLKGDNLLDKKYRTRPEFRQAGRVVYGGVQASF